MVRTQNIPVLPYPPTTTTTTTGATLLPSHLPSPVPRLNVFPTRGGKRERRMVPRQNIVGMCTTIKGHTEVPGQVGRRKRHPSGAPAPGAL